MAAIGPIRLRALPAMVAVLASVGAAGASDPTDPELRLAPCRVGRCVAARLPAELAGPLAAREIPQAAWRRALAVRTETAAAIEPPGPTVFGRYRLHGTELWFEPRLPFLPGSGYVATLDAAVLSGLLRAAGTSSREAGQEVAVELRFRLLDPERPAPRVLAIHPAAERVPANLLRAYVHFSAPMRPDVARDYLRLVDERGRVVAGPFVEIDGGLWDPTQTRLTLLFHPGRIKRGVAPRELQGPPLREGGSYRLVIDAGWPAATGEPLAEGASRVWMVAADDREPVSPAGWSLDLPAVGTREPLEVEFGEALDQALAARLIGVTRRTRLVAGVGRVNADGSGWSFEPERPWPPGDHALVVESELEDLAGNNLRGVFDREPGDRSGPASRREIVFRPRPR